MNLSLSSCTTWIIHRRNIVQAWWLTMRRSIMQHPSAHRSVGKVSKPSERQRVKIRRMPLWQSGLSARLWSPVDFTYARRRMIHQNPESTGATLPIALSPKSAIIVSVLRTGSWRTWQKQPQRKKKKFKTSSWFNSILTFYFWPSDQILMSQIAHSQKDMPHMNQGWTHLELRETQNPITGTWKTKWYLVALAFHSRTCMLSVLENLPWNWQA